MHVHQKQELAGVTQQPEAGRLGEPCPVDLLEASSVRLEQADDLERVVGVDQARPQFALHLLLLGAQREDVAGERQRVRRVRARPAGGVRDLVEHLGRDEQGDDVVDGLQRRHA